jgi:hypothetical protein
MSDLGARALDTRRFAGEMWSSAADSAEQARVRLEQHPALTAVALGLAALLLVLIGSVAGALRRSSRRHQASHLRDDLVDAVRMGEIDPDDFRVFAMIDFCDQVARRGRRPHAGRHASSRPVLDSALASSLISAVGPGSLLPPGGPFWPYAAPEPGEVEVSDVWVRAVSFQRDLMGKRRSRTDAAVEPVPTPGSGPARRRLVSVPTPTTIDLRGTSSSGNTTISLDGPVPPPALVSVEAPSGIKAATSLGETPASQSVTPLDEDAGTSRVASDQGTLTVELAAEQGTSAVGSGADESVLSAESVADLGSLIEDDAMRAEADAVRLLEVVPDPAATPVVTSIVAAEPKDADPVASVSLEPVVPGEETAACVEATETETEDEAEVELGSSAGEWFLEGQARPFDPLTDPLTTPSFRRGDAPSQELEPVFMAAAEAQRAAERTLREHREQQRILRERVARRWEAIEQVAQEAQVQPAQEIDLRTLEAPHHIDLTRVEQEELVEEREPVPARRPRGIQTLQSLIQAPASRSDAIRTPVRPASSAGQGSDWAEMEQSRTGAGRPGSGRAMTPVAEGRGGGLGGTESGHGEGGRNAAGRTGVGRAESGRAGASRAESGRADAGRDEPGRVGADATPPGLAGSGPAEAREADPARAGLSQAEFRRVDVGQADSAKGEGRGDGEEVGRNEAHLTELDRAQLSRAEIGGIESGRAAGQGAGAGRIEASELGSGRADADQGEAIRPAASHADLSGPLAGQAKLGQVGRSGDAGLGAAEVSRGQMNRTGSSVRGESSPAGADQLEVIAAAPGPAGSVRTGSSGFGARQAGMAKHAISGPIDLPLSLGRAKPGPTEEEVRPKDEAPPTNPIPRLDLPIATESTEPDESDEPDEPEAAEPRPRWMTPAETPVARTEQVGGVIEPAGSNDPNDDRAPRGGFWGRRVHRRPRTSLTEVTGHGKPPGALMPFTGQIPVQGGATVPEGRESEDEPARG